MNNINILIIILNIIINLLTYCFKRITVECKRMSHIKVILMTKKVKSETLKPKLEKNTKMKITKKVTRKENKS